MRASVLRVFLSFSVLLLFTLGPEVLNAQTAKQSAYRGKIVSRAENENDGEAVQIYEKANFDSRVVGIAVLGQTYDISKNIFNHAFYKIRLRPGLVGYIAESDIEPLFKNENRPTKNSKKPKRKSNSKRNKTFEYTRFGGLSYALIDFTEDTMGGKARQNLGFIGAKISGPNVLLDGLLPIDVNLMFYSGAPSYYEKATGHGASGFIFLGDILFQTYWPQGPRALTYFGFGPLFKYSKFDVEMRDSVTTKTQTYSLEDISLGVAFDLGVGFRLGSLALRVDYQYFWEKQMYGGFTGAIQWAF